MSGGQTPKQKQSYSRTHKRRAQHKIVPAASNECPQCHQPKLPHRVCPSCGSYKGQDVLDSGAQAPVEE
jgi:large subunit ribosomal protein L32